VDIAANVIVRDRIGAGRISVELKSSANVISDHFDFTA
jgi:hypothetical protein